jgi:uncharacterized protein YjbI with pentapeptide repeats
MRAFAQTVELRARGVRLLSGLSSRRRCGQAFRSTVTWASSRLAERRHKAPEDQLSMTAHRFEHCNMGGAAFDDVSLKQATFNDVNLGQATFSNVNLQKARFADVNLSGVEIEDANIEGLMIFGIDIHALIQAELSRKDE